MEKPTILFQMHIMWYESEMLNETLDSVLNAIQSSKSNIHLKFCLNSQTYIESPISGSSDEMFNLFINHKIFELDNVEVIRKTNDDPFYNIGDWRREMYNSEYKYVVWGESDALVPIDYFWVLDNLHIDEPHIVSLSSRKMWDYTWRSVEHELVRDIYFDNVAEKLGLFGCGSYITSDQVNSFNRLLSKINLVKLKTPKIDGSLLALSANLPTPFIAPKQHFINEDTCASAFFSIHGIPQFNISTRIKGHNYNHPRKRTNTEATRNDETYLKYADESRREMNEFLSNLYYEKNG